MSSWRFKLSRWITWCGRLAIRWDGQAGGLTLGVCVPSIGRGWPLCRRKVWRWGINNCTRTRFPTSPLELRRHVIALTTQHGKSNHSFFSSPTYDQLVYIVSIYLGSFINVSQAPSLSPLVVLTNNRLLRPGTSILKKSLATWPLIFVSKTYPIHVAVVKTHYQC